MQQTPSDIPCFDATREVALAGRLGIHKAVIFGLLMLLSLVAPYGGYTGNSGALGSTEAGSSDWTEVSTWNITGDIYAPYFTGRRCS